MATSFKKPKASKKADPEAADQLAKELADKPYDEPVLTPEIESPPILEEETKAIQLKVALSLHKEFKTYSAARGMKMVELFKKMFDEYKKNHE